MKWGRDLTGQRYGRLTATALTSERAKDGRIRVWACQCDCGNIKKVRSDLLRNGTTKSCGCLMSENARKQRARCWQTAAANRRSLVGQRFGRLVVLKISSDRPGGANKHKYWLCVCDCGNRAEVDGSKLRLSKTQSCGCLVGERAGSVKARAKALHTWMYKHSPVQDIEHYLEAKRVTRKVEQCLTQTK